VMVEGVKPTANAPNVDVTKRRDKITAHLRMA
jgi:hypothetical protein